MEIAALYYKTPNAWADRLCAGLDVYAQAIYTQLLRLSWGHHRETCTIGYPRLAERAHLSVTGARKGIKGLVAAGLVEQVGVDLANASTHERGVTWLVRLPAETPTREGAPTQQIGATRQEAATQRGPMKELGDKETVQTPLSVYDVRRVLARLAELHHGEPDYDRERLRRDIRTVFAGEGREVDDRLIDDAIGS